MESKGQRRLVRVINNAIREYLDTTSFGWVSTSGYSGEDGQRRALDFQQRLAIMSDLHILERCVKIFEESTILKRHIINHLVISGIWYDALAGSLQKEESVMVLIDEEINRMKRGDNSYLRTSHDFR